MTKIDDQIRSTLIDPTNERAQLLLELLKYEYIGMFGEPDPNPVGELDAAIGMGGQVIVIETHAPEHYPIAICGVTLEEGGQDAVLRRMFTRWEWRNRGLGRVLLAEAEKHALKLGASRLKLETGVEMTVARHLYASSGYRKCEPFGFYERNPTSRFLAKDLT